MSVNKKITDETKFLKEIQRVESKTYTMDGNVIQLKEKAPYLYDIGGETNHPQSCEDLVSILQ